MQIIVKNKIEEQVKNYQARTGATKTWIAKQLSMSNQNLHNVFRAINPTIETLIKFSLLLECDVKELYTFTLEK